MQTAIQLQQHDEPTALPGRPGDVIARPSQISNLDTYVWAVIKACIAGWIFYKLRQRWDLPVWALLLPLGIFTWDALHSFLNTKYLSFEIDPERITWHMGILSRTSSTIEICRIQSVTMHQSLFERIFKIGTIHIDTVDPIHSWIRIPGIQRPDELRRFLVQYTQTARQNRGNQEVYAL